MPQTQTLPSVEFSWRAHAGPQELFLSLPDTIFEAFYGGAAGPGKALHINTKLYRLDSEVEINDIRVGDKILHPSGEFTPVLAMTDVHEEDTYKVTLDNGENIIVGANHKWLTFNYQERMQLYKSAEEYREKRKKSRLSRSTGKRPDLALRNSLRNPIIKIPIGTVRSTSDLYDNYILDNNRLNYSIPLPSPAIYPKQKLDIDPYLLGLWLGDGSSYGGKITTSDTFIIDEISKLGYDTKFYGRYEWGIHGLESQLKELNLIRNKHIPTVYLHSSYEQRLSLLQGLMDSDGYCSGRDHQCQFTQTNISLLKQVAQLAYSLGLKVNFTFGTAKINGREVSGRYTISWTSKLNVFRLPRKIQSSPTTLRATQNNYYIKEINKVSNRDLKCITVGASDGMFVCGEGFIPTHNSEALLMLPIARKFYQISTFHGIILRRTFRQLEGSLILRAHQYYPLFGGKYNEQKKRYTFPSGAIMDFGHAEHEKDITGYDTAEYHYVAMDELTHFTEYQYKYMFSRCRTSDPRLPSIMRTASNPGNIGHGWVRKRFIEPCREGGKLLVDKNTGQKRIFIPGFVSDNPTLLKADPDYIRRLELLPEAEKRAKLYGDWWTFTGQVFEEFRSEKFNDEPQNAIHVIPSFNIPHWVPRILAIDWGFSAFLWCGWAAIFPNGKVIIYREYMQKREKISTWAPNVVRLSQNEKIDCAVLDPSAWQQRGDEKTIAAQITDYFSGFLPDPERADNDRVGGKMLFHEYLRWTPRPPKTLVIGTYDQDVYNWIIRNRGLKAAQDYQSAFKEDVEDTSILPKLQIFNNCTGIINAIPLCVYDENNPEDVAEFDGDDPYDGGRYLLKKAEQFILAGKNRESSEMRNAEIYSDFEKDGDYFRLTRRLEAAENGGTIFSKPKSSFGIRPKVRRIGARVY